MGKTLSAIIGATALSLASCASNKYSPANRRIVIAPTYEKPIQTHVVPGNITGGQVQTVNNEQAEFSAEFKIIYGDSYAAKPNLRALSNEDSWMLQRWDDLELVRDDATKESRLESEAFYVPEVVTNDKGAKAIRIPLDKDGLYGMAADVNEFKSEEIDLGIATLTQDDVAYNFRTLIIGKDEFAKEYFFPRVSEKQMIRCDNPEALNFYLMPVEGTIIRTRLIDGSLVLENLNGVIERPVRVTRREYEKRPMPEIKIERDPNAPNSGEADELEFDSLPMSFGTQKWLIDPSKWKGFGPGEEHDLSKKN